MILKDLKKLSMILLRFYNSVRENPRLSQPVDKQSLSLRQGLNADMSSFDRLRMTPSLLNGSSSFRGNLAFQGGEDVMRLAERISYA